jgi:agmatine/peptidylarginine deiminase
MCSAPKLSRRPVIRFLPISLFAFGAFSLEELKAQAGGNGPGFGPPGGDEVIWEQVAEDFYRRFSESTEAISIEHLALPWEPVQAVVVVIPLKEWQSDPELARIFSDMVAALLPRVSVIGLYHENDYRLLGDWMRSMEADSRIVDHLEKLELVASEPYSLWARDFVPLFGRGSNGQLVAVDSSFLPVRRMMNNLQNAKSEFDPVQQYLSLRDGAAELKGRRGSDHVSAALVPFLETRLQVPTALSRPPVYLLGGDILLGGSKTALVSADSLMENGGRSEAFKQSLRDYYGVTDVYALENLPGDSIEHLDFIMQPLGEDVIVVARPPASFGTGRSYHRYLERELKARLERNRAHLEQIFPKHRFVELPMLPPLLDDEAAVVNQLLLHCIERIANQRGLPFWPESREGVDPLSEESLGPDLARAARIALGLFDWDNPVARREAVQSYLGQAIEELAARHVEEHVNYRSYVNSLLVRTATGNDCLLVPRFQPQNVNEQSLVARLEHEVEEAYGEALPGVALIWIDCTALTDFLGAVHCLTATVPDLKALGVTSE